MTRNAPINTCRGGGRGLKCLESHGRRPEVRACGPRTRQASRGGRATGRKDEADGRSEASRVKPEFRLQGLSIYPPKGLQSACRADFIVAQGNALGSEVVVGCALKGHFNLLRSSKLRRAYSAQLIRSAFSQGVALGYDDSAPLGRVVAIVRLYATGPSGGSWSNAPANGAGTVPAGSHLADGPLRRYGERAGKTSAMLL